MQDNESSYPLLREYHTLRDWVQLRGNPSGGWTVFLGDSIGCGLWQWRAAYCGNLRDASSVYQDEANRARKYRRPREHRTINTDFIAKALKGKTE